MIQPEMAIIRCLKFSYYKENAVFTIIIVIIIDVTLLFAYCASCVCV
jgi:hypothetical protein